MIGEVIKLTKRAHLDLNLRYKQVKNDICIYQVQLIVDGIILRNIIRLCYASELKELCNNTITFSNTKHRDLDSYLFFKSDIKEAMRENLKNMSNEKYVLAMEDILDEKVDISNAILGKIDLYTDNFYEYGNNIPIPKSVNFDYTNGDIDNAHYNLEEVLKFLENRKDITINRDKYTFAIHDIPHYNTHYSTYYNRDKYIDFTWHPTDEDWNKYVNSEYFEKWYRYDYIANEIIGLKQYLKENNND